MNNNKWYDNDANGNTPFNYFVTGFIKDNTWNRENYPTAVDVKSCLIPSIKTCNYELHVHITITHDVYNKKYEYSIPIDMDYSSIDIQSCIEKSRNSLYNICDDFNNSYFSSTL